MEIQLASDLQSFESKFASFVDIKATHVDRCRYESDTCVYIYISVYLYIHGLVPKKGYVCHYLAQPKSPFTCLN